MRALCWPSALTFPPLRGGAPPLPLRRRGQKVGPKRILRQSARFSWLRVFYACVTETPRQGGVLFRAFALCRGLIKKIKCLGCVL
jgi:hypothetical protein